MQLVFLLLSGSLLLRSGSVNTFDGPLNTVSQGHCQIDPYCAPFDCGEVFQSGLTLNGVYLIYPTGRQSNPVPVYCDMTTPGGPWTVFQKRFNGSVDFYRGWKEYRSGFGKANGEYWLGLDTLHLMTTRKHYRLRIQLSASTGESRFVTYSRFAISHLAISAEEDNYKLHIDGFQEGDPNRPTGNSLLYHNGLNFSTYDHDNDRHTNNCAELYQGAFWYSKCHYANLNGRYLNGTTDKYALGMVWRTWKGYYDSLTSSEMKIASLA